MKQQNLHNSESGRSMVEILGVLAIIGVLSITAVAGYSYAMTKNKTNQILNGLSKAQVMIQSALDTGANDIRLPSNGSLTSLSKTILKSYGLDEYEPVGMGCPGDTYDVVLNNIPTDVCKMLVADGVGTYIAVDVRDSANENKNKYCRDLNNPNESCTTNDEKVQIAFTFEIEMNQGASGNKDDPCATCTTAQDCLTIAGEKKCVSSCPSGTTRDDETGNCTNDKCTDYTNCDEGDFCNFDSACATTGTCKAISQISSKTGTLTVSGVEYNAVCSAAGSSNLNSFYKAKDWCLAMGGRLLTSDETCARTENTYGTCPSDDAAATLRTQIHSLCNAGFGSDWLWVYRSGNNRNSCYMFSIALSSEGAGTYENGGKSDRRAVCLFPN